MKLLLLGATGLVGRHVLELALRDPRVTQVTAPVRRAIPRRDRLHATQADFDHLPEAADWWAADAVICALGTTRRKAGSAFRHIDHDIVIAALRLARSHGTPTLALVSAAGANERSPFLYHRVKGETERDAIALGFASVTILRPGLIDGDRTEGRPAERVALAILRAVQPALPRTMHVNPAERIARKSIEAAMAAAPGVRFVRSGELA